MCEKKADIKINKTVTALYKSLYTLLKYFNFRKITIEALCAEALISRAAFYSHFNDKYDLLTKWLIMLISKNINRGDSYDKIEKTVNQFISENKWVLKNIVDDADSDTLRELYRVTRFIINFSIQETSDEKKNTKNAVWDSFFIGGFIYYRSLQLYNEGLSDITPMNIHLYTTIKCFREACLMNDKIERINAIKNGIGLQQILDEAYNILGNPMLIFDMDYRLVAYTDVKNDDPIWNEFIENGRLSPETIGFSMAESFIDTAANSDGRAYLLISEKQKYNRIIGQLYNGKDEPVADLAVVACKKPFEDDDQSLIRMISDKISKEIGNDEYYLNYGKAYIENMVIRLLKDDFEDRRLYTDHIANIYRGFKKYIYVAVASISQNGSVNNLVYFKDLMKQTQSNFKYTIYQNHVVILFSSSYKIFRAKRELQELYNLFEQENVYVGVSKSFENIFELPKHYAEAVDALNERKSNNNERYYAYNLLAELKETTRT